MREEWVLTYKDYVAAQKLYVKKNLMRRFYMLMFMWVLPGILLMGAGVFLLQAIHNPDHEATSRGYAQIWPVLFLVFVFRLSYWWNLRKGYKRLFLNGDPTRPVYMDLDDERVLSGIPGSSEGKFFWPTIVKFEENDKIALLYISKRQFLMIPKNSIAPDSWAQMRSLIAGHVSGVN